MLSHFSKFAVLGIVSSLSLVACDSSAREASAQQTPTQVVELASEMESCSTSAQCTKGLRCVELQCRNALRSRLGDFRAAEGRASLSKENFSEAAVHYNSAVTQYEKDGIALPIDILCEQGNALARARGDLKFGEAAARVLHRCVLALPPSSSLANVAYDSLVSLREVGLDPNVLGRADIADLYLGGQAMKVAPKEMRLLISDDGKASKKRGFNALLEGLKTPAAKVAFDGCWTQYRKGSKSKVLKVRLPFSFRYVMDEDDEARDRFLLKLEAPVISTGVAKRAAAQCIASTTNSLTAEMSKSIRDRSSWKSTVTLEMSE